MVSLQLAKATQWDVIRTYVTTVTTWQTVINSNCINGSNIKKKNAPPAAEKGVREVKIRNVCKNLGPPNVPGEYSTLGLCLTERKKKFLLLCI